MNSTKVFIEQANEIEKTEGKKDTKEKQSDLLAVAKITGADSLILVNLVANMLQKNLYATDPLRVTKVMSDVVVQASSVTVVDVRTGSLILSGYVDYPDGTTLLNASKSIGQGLQNN